MLTAAREGEPTQVEKVFALLYSELRQLAAARLGNGNHTLSPTALVHEVFLRLTANRDLNLNDRRHFFACAARSMRCIVIDHARHSSASGVGRSCADHTQ